MKRNPYFKKKNHRGAVTLQKKKKLITIGIGISTYKTFRVKVEVY